MSKSYIDESRPEPIGRVSKENQDVTLKDVSPEPEWSPEEERAAVRK
jgi:hypothetical protein